jgi:hypothetical protein
MVGIGVGASFGHGVLGEVACGERQALEEQRHRRTPVGVEVVLGVLGVLRDHDVWAIVRSTRTSAVFEATSGSTSP